MADSSGGGLGSAAVAAVVTAAVTGALAWLTPFWGWLWALLSDGWTHLGGKSGLPNWMLYLLALISAHSIASRALRWIRTSADSHTRFSELHFLGPLWRWRYISGTPANWMAFCPVCDTRLVCEETGSRYYSGPGDELRVLLHCEHCSAVRLSQEGNLTYLKERVGREIDRIIRTGKWRDHVPPLTK